MKNKTRLLILWIAFVFSALFATGMHLSSLFNLQQSFIEAILIDRLFLGLIFAGFVNVVLFFINSFKTRNGYLSTVLLIFSIILFPLSIAIGMVMVLPYTLYAIYKMLLKDIVKTRKTEYFYSRNKKYYKKVLFRLGLATGISFIIFILFNQCQQLKEHKEKASKNCR